jgi:hypothetical protein
MLVTAAALAFAFLCLCGSAWVIVSQHRLIRDLCDRLSIKQNVTPLEAGKLPPYLQAAVQSGEAAQEADHEVVVMDEDTLLEQELMALRKQRSSASPYVVNGEPPRVPFRFQSTAGDD